MPVLLYFFFPISFLLSCILAFLLSCLLVCLLAFLFFFSQALVYDLCICLTTCPLCILSLSLSLSLSFSLSVSFLGILEQAKAPSLTKKSMRPATVGDKQVLSCCSSSHIMLYHVGLHFLMCHFCVHSFKSKHVLRCQTHRLDAGDFLPFQHWHTKRVDTPNQAKPCSDTKDRVLSIQILTRSKREFGAGASASLGARVLDPSFTSVQDTSRHLFGLSGSGFGAGAFAPLR